MNKYYAEVTVKNALCLLVAFTSGDKDDFGEAQRLMEKMKPADVVEVVRCKDCKHFEQAECPWDELFLINVNGYCSRGERKEGEG